MFYSNAIFFLDYRFVWRAVCSINIWIITCIILRNLSTTSPGFFLRSFIFLCHVKQTRTVPWHVRTGESKLCLMKRNWCHVQSKKCYSSPIRPLQQNFHACAQTKFCRLLWVPPIDLPQLLTLTGHNRKGELQFHIMEKPVHKTTACQV